MSLLPVAQAQARLFALADRLPVEDAPVTVCAGRWLARDILAQRAQPWADLSAMDGYAVRAAEAPGPWHVTMTSSAGGTPPPPLAPGEACRIFTGAPLPAGADAILIQENATRDGDSLTASADPLAPGRHVRPAASDFAKGAPLLKARSRLGPTQIALAVLGGHGHLPVGKRPRVALLSTGDELVPPGAPTPPGALPSSNAPMLAAMLTALPCDVIDLGIVPDDLDAMVAALDRARHADIIVSTGGASVGDHDMVRPAFAQAGGTLDFWKIAMRPGKPLMFGRLGDAGVPVLGLPGNPVSALVCAILFLIPAIARLAGLPAGAPPTERARLGAPLPANDHRADHLRARLEPGPDGEAIATAFSRQDSAMMHRLAAANALILRAPNAPALEAGAVVTVIRLDRLGV